ncbi:uncharacterized protein EV420DRAFT_1643104 [Desarmillaria tabescens]|uniref:F-box domain-containing protein n=1 Tax=Armillaria tabescens TaxID=1929756 RepID=A0AA39N5J9_ARMTA|nr:uncharacterized protein EV420DRAFT_1643104 [Desarmillaria tabescens]KAK0458224.1 hypothetical protein EV420DRAFT_1643104 [Desarmillaria tabescens]
MADSFEVSIIIGGATKGDRGRRVLVGDYLCQQVPLGARLSLGRICLGYLSKFVPMHLSKLKFKLRLKVLTPLGRVKRLGKPCPAPLLSFPSELLQEIASFLSKRDQKALRFVCHQLNDVLRATVLSAVLINLILPLRYSDQDALQYLASHTPASYIYRLRVCVWGSYSEQHPPTHWRVAEGGNSETHPPSARPRLQTKSGIAEFRALHNRAFASLTNLRAFTLCISNGSRKAPPHLFEDTFTWLMKRPSLDLHLTHPEFTLPYFSHLSQIRNIRKFSLTGYSNNSTPTIEKTLARVFANNQYLSDVFLHLVDRWGNRRTSLAVSGIERVFPKHATRTIPLRHLSLKISNVDFYHAYAGFWMELSQQGIYIPSITPRCHSVPSPVVDYLASNEGMTELTFEVETNREDTSRRVLSEVVPRHSGTLEVLQLISCWGSHWVFGNIPGYVVSVSKCVNLRILGVVVEGNKDFTEPLLCLLKFLSNLQTLRLVPHTNDFGPIVKRVERIRDDEPLLRRLQVIVSVSYQKHIKFVAERSKWDVDNEEADWLQDDPWYLGV